MSIKIAHVCRNDIRGGASIAAYRLHTAMNENGLYSRMFVFEKGSADPTVVKLGTRNQRYRYKAITYIERFVKKVLRLPVGIPASLNCIRSPIIDIDKDFSEFDVVHLHWVGAGFLSLNQIANINRPVVWTFHDLWAVLGVFHYPIEYHVLGDDAPSNYIVSYLERKLRNEKLKIINQNNMAIVCPSYWMFKSIIDHVDRQERVRIIANCLGNAENQYRSNSKNQTLKNEFVVLFGAVNSTKDRRKGIDLLLQALDLLDLSQLPGKVLFKVFGGTLAESKRLSNGIEVQSLGQVSGDENLADLYNASDVFVLSSRMDNLPNTVLEGLSCGLPVVAFDVGGVADLVTHKENGYLAQPYDISDLADGVAWVLMNISACAPKRLEISERMRLKYLSSDVVSDHVRLYNWVTDEVKRQS